MLNFFFSWDAIPLETKTPMVERLELYPYSSFPLYWEDTLPAAAFLDRELLRGLLLPPPLEKKQHGVLHVLPDLRAECGGISTCRGHGAAGDIRLLVSALRIF